MKHSAGKMAKEIGETGPTRTGLGWKMGLRQPLGFPYFLKTLFFLAVLLITVPLPVFALDPFKESNGQVVMEAENYDAKVPRSGKDWTFFTSTGTTASGTGYLQALPNTGGIANSGFTTISPELQYRINFTTTGTYYVWIRGFGPTTADDSVHAGIDGTAPASSDRIGNFPNSWTWKYGTLDNVPATIIVSTAGIHMFNLWVREDGFKVDKILLRTSSSATAPSGTGPAESPRGGSNGAPVINSITPATGSKYYEQDAVTVTVNASDPDGDSLQYQFSVGGVVKQPWGALSTYSMASSERNYGKKTIAVSVRDGRGGEVSASTVIFFYKRPLKP